MTWNGAGDYFTITYRVEGQSTEKSLNATTNSIVLSDLTPLTSYVIRISGATREGRIGERRIEVFTTDGPGKWDYNTPLLSPVNIHPTGIWLSVCIIVTLPSGGKQQTFYFVLFYY